MKRTATDTPDKIREARPSGLAWLAGLACVACCAIPFLITAGIIGGTGWAVLAHAMPAVAFALAVAAAGAWWWRTRRSPSQGGCSCASTGCGCREAAA